MKYTFEYKGKQKTIDIPQEYIDQQRRSLGKNLSTKEIIELYLFDKGYEDNAEANALTAKANANGAVQHDVKGKTRKAPVRKPDEVKRELIAGLYNYISTFEGVQSPQVENIERIITFSLGEENYSLTLAKKRKPKN